MRAFTALLRENANYRNTWTGQVISEIGDHFNNIAVFSLAVETTRSALVVSGVMLARAIPAMLVAPVAGVLLDRLDRKRVMIASDLVRAVIALGFIFTLGGHKNTWLLYALSAALMVASPFFTSGRSSILPSIATGDDLHTANSLTQTTQWMTLTIGTFLGGASVAGVGYQWAFVANAISFLISAACIARLRLPGRGFRPPPRVRHPERGIRPWHEYAEGLGYIWKTPLIFGLAMVNVGWASGGGAAQILFPVFGEIVFDRGPVGLGWVWAMAGVGLIVGGTLAYTLGPKLSFGRYKSSISICYVVHGGAYILFSQAQTFTMALFFIALSRAGVGFSSIMNKSQLLRHVPDEFRGRVFATMETSVWSVMLISMALAGVATQYWDPRTVGMVAGILSSSTAIFWGLANWTGKLPEPPATEAVPDDIEYGQPRV